MAARTVYEAVDAATTSSPAPNASSSQAVREHSRASAGTRQQVSATPTLPSRATVERAVRSAGQLQGSARAARQSVLAPVKRASRAVSLEIAGSFFALFALSFGAAAWRFRSLAMGRDGQRLWVYLAFAALFAYFSVSSFLRARRISQP